MPSAINRGILATLITKSGMVRYNQEFPAISGCRFSIANATLKLAGYIKPYITLFSHDGIVWNHHGSPLFSSQPPPEAA
jgi:hypothetical protein